MKHTYLVIYKSSLTGQRMEKTVRATSKDNAQSLTKGSCSVEHFIGDPLKLD